MSTAARAPRPAVAATGLAAKGPPALLPGLHFGFALLCLASGAAGLVWYAPALVAADFLAGRVVALTHLFTLGWITTSIMGALYQLLPVALQQPIRSERVAYATLLLYAPGLVAFVAGLATRAAPVMLAGAAALGLGIVLFLGNLAATLARARRRDVTWWALAFAAFYLAVTLVLGLALSGNLRWGYLGAGRVPSIGVHLHVALAGWVLLVMIGVAHRLLPMFLLSHGVKDHFARAAVALVAAGAGMLSLLHHAPPLVSRWLPALAIALGCGAFLLQARSYFVRRHRPVLDPGMRLAAAALLLLGMALVLAVPVMATGATLRVNVAYVAALLLAISLFVAAHYYKIVPFLVWHHRWGPRAGRQAVPKITDLYSTGTASLAGAALAVGAFLLVAGIAFGSQPLARIAALLFAAGAGTEAVQMLLVWRRRS